MNIFFLESTAHDQLFNPSGKIIFGWGWIPMPKKGIERKNRNILIYFFPITSCSQNLAFIRYNNAQKKIENKMMMLLPLHDVSRAKYICVFKVKVEIDRQQANYFDVVMAGLRENNPLSIWVLPWVKIHHHPDTPTTQKWLLSSRHKRQHFCQQFKSLQT